MGACFLVLNLAPSPKHRTPINSATRSFCFHVAWIEVTNHFNKYFSLFFFSLLSKNRQGSTWNDPPLLIRLFEPSSTLASSLPMCCPRYADACSHVEYPCRFQDASAATQEIIPHRVFAPLCLEGACQEALLWLVPPCLSAAHSVLGTHPFSRLDILIVPANFPSLGMARYVFQHGTWSTRFRSLGTARGMFFLNSVSSFVCSGWKEKGSLFTPGYLTATFRRWFSSRPSSPPYYHEPVGIMAETGHRLHPRVIYVGLRLLSGC